uniref:Uncharacterized protein n=1 Tax=Daphnia magna TaxID=35525 RepID=A0A0P6DK81_9CRUS
MHDDCCCTIVTRIVAERMIMHLFSHVMLIAAAVLLTNFQATRSFTLDRNVDDHDSLENTTDSPLTSLEHGQNNATSTEDDSLEVQGRLIKRNFKPDGRIVDDSKEKLDTKDDPIDSVEILKNQTSVEDDLDATNDSLQIADSLMKRNVPIASSQDNGHQLFDFDSLEVHTADISDEMQSTTTDDDLFDDLVDSMEIVKNQTSTEDVADANDDDVSLENKDDSSKRVALPTVSVFDHLPVIGVFSHPASDDLYIVKQYMGDYYVWEMGDDSAREYFTHPGKGFPKTDFDSPLKVKADQFARFTPVRSLPNQRLHTLL